MAVILSEFQSGEWPKKFDAELERHSFASESLKNLEGEGIKRRVLLSFLYDYSHPSSVKAQRALRKWAAGAAKRLEKTEKQMSRSAGELEAVLDDINMGFPTALQSLSEVSTINALKAAAERVRSLSKHYQRISSQRGKARNEERLVYLCLLVEGITGRAHWEDLAYLLDVAFATHGENEDWDEDAVRKVVARFQKAHPDFYAELRAYLVDQHREKAKPAALKRSTVTRRAALNQKSSAAGYLDRYITRLPKGGRESAE